MVLVMPNDPACHIHGQAFRTKQRYWPRFACLICSWSTCRSSSAWVNLFLLLWNPGSMAAWSNCMLLGKKDRVSEQIVSERRLIITFQSSLFCVVPLLFQTIWLARILSIRFTKVTKLCFTSLPCCLSLQTIHNRWRTCVQLSVKSRVDFL